MSALLTDDNGIPVPQYFNPTANSFQTMKGQDGAILVLDSSKPVDGIYKVKLISKDDKEVIISESSIPVSLVDASVNNMYFTGTKWVQSNRSCNMPILSKNTYTAATVPSARVYNNGCKNALVCFKIDAGTNTLAGLSIDIMLSDGTAIPYKTITFISPLGAGNYFVSFGVDDIDNKIIIPADFKLNFNHTSPTVAIAYEVGLQLV